MPDNPQSIPAPWFALSDHRLVALEGRDAVVFAQAQTMNDVAALADGHWQWNGWLTPKGRVIALFALVRMAADTVWLVVPDADAAALAERLRRFVFRSKVAIAVRDDLQAAGRLSASRLASGNHWVDDTAGGIELDLGSASAGRALRIGPAMAVGQDPAALVAWRRIDLEHGWPRLDAGQSEQWTPQQLSLERLQAFSVKKGCYPGQEIVARTHFLGQAKRGLALIRGAAGLSPGDPLVDGPDEAGTVVSVAADTALAVVARRPEATSPAGNDGSPATGGASWRYGTLLEGLAR